MVRNNAERVRPAEKNRKPGSALRKPARSATRASASYLKLAAVFPIRPLRSVEELDEAVAVLDRLLARKKPLDEQEAGYRDSLSHEVRRYEEVHVPMPVVSGPAMLRHLIEAREATLSEVAAATGIAVSTLSSVLGGKRALNLGHIDKLAQFFGVARGVFLE